MPEGRTLHSQEIPLQIPQPFGGQIEQHPELGQLLIRPCRRLVHNHLLAPHPALFCAGRANCRQEAVIACSISRMGSTNAVRPGIIGRAGELVTHASLVGAAPLGYRLPLLCRRLGGAALVSAGARRPGFADENRQHGRDGRSGRGVACRGLAVAGWRSGALSMERRFTRPVSRSTGAAPAGEIRGAAETDADRLVVVSAGIQGLQGHAAVLELA
jgi:hypothetical protein